MAPAALLALRTESIVPINPGQYKEQSSGPGTYVKDVEEKGNEDFEKATYPHYLPTWNPEQKYPPLEPFKHVEHGVNADAEYPDLLGPSVVKDDLTPNIGSSIKGVQISKLSDAGKNQLALLTAQRKVLAFRDQDFADLPIHEALNFGGYFGRHHIHPSSGSPEGFPEIHLVHRGAGDNKSAQQLLSQRTSSVAWHSDVTYEQQPPGTTFLYIFDKPKTGGDTIFVDQVEAYRRLSPGFQERLHGLKAVHSGIEQAQASKARGSIVRREPVTNEHPIVRTHPATGEKALFVNPQCKSYHPFTRYIVGYKKEESDALLKFLYDHIGFGSDFQARVKWEEKTVIVWDNRVTCHTAILDWANGQRRHLARITPQAERPYETPYEKVPDQEY
ncbi:hypothetical protein MMC14_006021 [Varicellaria rhodocarpa]|nr:hypothetical protein [Varicellaria rhodocarpa]